MDAIKTIKSLGRNLFSVNGKGAFRIHQCNFLDGYATISILEESEEAKAIKTLFVTRLPLNKEFHQKIKILTNFLDEKSPNWATKEIIRINAPYEFFTVNEIKAFNK